MTTIFIEMYFSFPGARSTLPPVVPTTKRPVDLGGYYCDCGNRFSGDYCEGIQIKWTIVYNKKIMICYYSTYCTARDWRFLGMERSVSPTHMVRAIPLNVCLNKVAYILLFSQMAPGVDQCEISQSSTYLFI